MIAIKGRRKCTSCGKRYNYTYSKGTDTEVIYKGKDANASVATNVRILSIYSYEVTVNCPECGNEETFIYTD